MAARRIGPAEKATRADVNALPPELAGSALAATALELARGMDADNSLTSKSMAAKAHMEIMDRLRELAPPKQEAKDGVDDIKEQRARRRARLAAAADLPRS